MNIQFSLDGKTRDRPVADDYLSALEDVLKRTDSRLGARIVSAGQAPKGSGGKRTGSTRHDVDHTGHSHTSDLVLTLDGKEIRPGDDKDLYARFLKNAAPKFPGIGHYDWGVHIGDGSMAMWGPDKTSKSIDPIFAKAISEGRSGTNMPAPARKKVSDPALLAKLNGSAKRKKVTDPALLEKLNGGAQAEPVMFDADRFGPSQKGERLVSASERGTLQGTEPGIGERVGNALYDAGKAIGLPVDRMRRDNQSADAFVRGAADIASVGTADEIAAFGGSVTGVGGEQGNYSGNLDYQRATDRFDAANQPIARGAGQLAGGVATGIVAAPRAAAANVLGRMWQGAKVGGAYGGAYGFGSGEGVENRLEEGAKGAFAGSLIGAAIPAATTAVSKTYNAISDLTVRPATNALRSTVNPTKNALRQTTRGLARDGLTPEQAAAKMEAAIAAGDDTTMLMDVAGDNTRRLGRFAANMPGEGANKIKEAVHARQLGQGERVTEAVRKGLDDPERYFSTVDDIIATRQTAAKPLYDKAWETPVPFTQKLESLLGRGKVMRDALKKARDLGEAEGIASKSFFAKIADDGSYTIESVPDARQWDLMKRSLDDIIEAEKTVLPNGTEKLSNLGRIVSGIKREMLAEIDKANPAYAKARAVYSSASESLDAVTKGGKLLDADPELARRTLQKMSDDDKELARLGIAKALVDRVNKVSDGLNAVKAIFASPKKRAVLREVFPSKEAFDEFKATMEREGAKTQTKTAISGNSTTAQQATDIADNQIDTGVVGNLMTGRLGAAAGAVVQKALARATVVNEATAKELVNILTTTDPAVAKQILGEMQRMAMKDARVAKNLVRIQSMLRNSSIVGGAKATADAF